MSAALDREFLFAFSSPERARAFVVELAKRLSHVFIYVANEHVRVIDGSENGQREEILRISRGSGGWRAAVD